MKKKLLIVHMNMYNGGAERSLLNFLTSIPPDTYEIDLLLFKLEGIYLKYIPPYVNLLTPDEALLNLYHNKNSILEKKKFFLGLVWKGIRIFSSGLSRILNGGLANSEKQIRWKLFYRHFIPKLNKHYDIAMAYSFGECTYYVVEKVTADRKLAWIHNEYTKTGMKSIYDYEYYKRIDGITTVSSKCQKIAQHTFPQVADKIVFLPNLISEDFVRDQADSFIPDDIDSKHTVLLSVGRLHPQKQPLLSIKTAALLKEWNIPFIWYWIGDGDLKKKMEMEIKKHHVENCFRLLGVRENPYPYIKACDIYVQNSLYEGKSIAIEEAKILCRPIVSTNFNTVHDQLDESISIITGMREDEIAEGIVKLINNPQLAQEMSDALKARHYGNEDCIADYIKWING